MTIVIIGSGLAGLAAAYKLADREEVIVLEKESELGGMAASYAIEFPDSGSKTYSIEKYYHHIFTGDKELIGLIDELGLGDELEWKRATTGYHLNGKIYPMNTPLEIMKALPLLDVIRLTLLVLKAKAIRDTTAFDNITARDWILENGGESVYNNFFEPLLESKFGENKDRVSAAWLLGRVRIRSNRGAKGERLGYMRGGFQSLVEGLADKIRERGGSIRTGKVSRIVIKDNSIQGVMVDGEYIECDKVISTVSPGMLGEIVDKGLLDFGLDISYQGTACVLFGLKEKIMDDTYWLNIKDDVPFGAVIEHTNFIPVSDYGEHLMYVTTYFQNRDSIFWKSSENEVVSLFLDGLEKLFPGIGEKVKWHRLQRDLGTAPVYEVGYGKKILPYKTNIKGLYLAGMFSYANYPERSMNGSILAGFNCVDSMENS